MPSAPTGPAAEHKREAILAAALELFTKHGYAGCPVPLVAERAGVATGTIYRYFPSKDALVNAVYQRWKGELKRILVDRQPLDDDGRAEFHEWWAGLTRFASDHPVAFAFLELHHHEPYLDDASRAIALEIDLAAFGTIERGQREHWVRQGDPALLVSLVFGAFSGVIRLRTAYPDLFPDDAFTQAEDAVWDLLHPTAPTKETDR